MIYNISEEVKTNKREKGKEMIKQIYATSMLTNSVYFVYKIGF
jgi:hypothetical protein